MFVSFLTADAGRIGEEGEAASPAWDSQSPEPFGDLVALRKTKRESPGRTINQAAHFGCFCGPAVCLISLPSHDTGPGLVPQSKDIMYITDFLCEEKKTDFDWIPLLHKVLYS